MAPRPFRRSAIHWDTKSVSNMRMAREFSEDLQKKFHGLLDAEIVLAQRKLCEIFLGVVIPGTPVDTGRARGGWQIGIGTVPSSETGAKDKIGIGTMMTARATLEQYATKVDAMAKSGSKDRRSTIVWVVNQVPYIEVLDRGFKRNKRSGSLVPWSRRGSGFFKRGIDKMRSTFR